jgi:hypothetical protein
MTERFDFDVTKTLGAIKQRASLTFATMNSSAHLETLRTPFIINASKLLTAYYDEYLPTKTNNKRKHGELGPDSMFLSEKQRKRVPSAAEEESDEKVSHIRSIVLRKL